MLCFAGNLVFFVVCTLQIYDAACGLDVAVVVAVVHPIARPFVFQVRMAQGPDGAGFKKGYRATPSVYASAERGAEVVVAAAAGDEAGQGGGGVEQGDAGK